MCVLSMLSCVHAEVVLDMLKLLHGIPEITPPLCQGYLMPKRYADIATNLLLHPNAKNTPRVAQPVKRFPLFRARLSVEEITYGELKYNIIPIVHAGAGQLLHLKWACPMLGIYGGGRREGRRREK